MTTTGTIHAHPSDAQVLLLKVPVDLNSDMGRFAPARFDLGMRAYLLLVEHLDSLRRFARTIDMHLIDQREAPPGDKALMPECKHCGQPARLLAQPQRCPGCGKPWQPAFIGAENPHNPIKKTCVRCGHKQLRSFAYCGQCGEVMPPDPDTPARRVEPARVRLDNPKPFGECIDETFELSEEETA